MKQELSIFDHIRASDMEHLTTLVYDNPDMVKLQDSDGCTPLHYAVELGHLESVEFLLDCDADANALNNSEQTPLFFVSGPQALEITQVLVDYGADVNHHDDVWSTPLAEALNRNLVEVCKFLLGQHADVADIIHDIDQTTPLMLAIKRGLPELAHLILDQSPDVSPRDFHQRNVLHYAAIRGFADLIIRCMQLRAEASARDEFGKTPLDYALERRRKIDAEREQMAALL